MEEALTLSDGERADLAACLLASLEPPSLATSGFTDAWVTELERRALAAAAGEAGVPWSEVRAEAERRLRDR